MLQSIQSIKNQAYSIDIIRDEAIQLIHSGYISRQQPLYVLCNYIPTREWSEVEQELEQHGFLLRDRIGDLISQKYWDND